MDLTSKSASMVHTLHPLEGVLGLDVLVGIQRFSQPSARFQLTPQVGCTAVNAAICSTDAPCTLIST